jgi:UDP-N-acetyl-D-mannosaminuronate dehydrogenase
VILATSHDAFKEIDYNRLKSLMPDRQVLVDVRNFYDPATAVKEGFIYRSL